MFENLFRVPYQVRQRTNEQQATEFEVIINLV